MLQKTQTLFLVVFASLFFHNANAEGTKELNPQADDLVILNLNDRWVQDFAAYNSTNKLYITAKTGERVYIGLSQLYNSHGDEPYNDPPYYFRVKDESGAIVLGPTLVNPSTANITTKAQAVAGPAAIGNTGGYATTSGFYFDAASNGDYYIEFSTEANSAPVSGNNLYLKYFDFTVASNNTSTATAINGRVWSKNWSFRVGADRYPNPGYDPSDPNSEPYIYNSNGGYTGRFNRPFNGKFYGYSSTDKTGGFTTSVDFLNSGFRPLSFNGAFNSTGPSTGGSITENRKSLDSSEQINPEYPLFLNNPDPTIWLDGTVGELSVGAFDITCGGTIDIEVNATQPGQVELVLDFNDNGVYDNNDIFLATKFESSGTNTVSWDRKDASGATIANGTTVPVIAKYTQGTLHFPVYDAEYNPTGFKVESVRPTTANFDGKLYYDDSNLTSGNNTPGTGAAKVQLNGCTSPCHNWTSFTNDYVTGYGNRNTINTWWNANVDIENLSFEVGVCALLPVEWLSFSGVEKNNQIHLSWSTASENNSSHFEIEKQMNNGQFVNIGTVMAKNQSTKISNYSFIDFNSFETNSIYRIKQVDLNGTFSYSNIISVASNLGANSFNVFTPSLSSNSVTVEYSILDGANVRFEISNIFGQLIYTSGALKQEKGVYSKTLNLSEKESLGIYLVTMYRNGNKETKKILIGN